MDEIQKTLIKAGHKDLAQEYYKKATALNHPSEFAIKIKPILRDLRVAESKASDGGTQALGYQHVHEITEKAIDELQKLNQSLSSYYGGWKGY